MSARVRLACWLLPACRFIQKPAHHVAITCAKLVGRPDSRDEAGVCASLCHRCALHGTFTVHSVARNSVLSVSTVKHKAWHSKPPEHARQARKLARPPQSATQWHSHPGTGRTDRIPLPIWSNEPSNGLSSVPGDSLRPWRGHVACQRLRLSYQTVLHALTCTSFSLHAQLPLCFFSALLFNCP